MPDHRKGAQSTDIFTKRHSDNSLNMGGIQIYLNAHSILKYVLRLLRINLQVKEFRIARRQKYRLRNFLLGIYTNSRK